MTDHTSDSGVSLDFGCKLKLDPTFVWLLIIPPQPGILEKTPQKQFLGEITSESDGRTLTLHPESGVKNVLKQHEAEIMHAISHAFKKNSYKI